MVPDDGEVAEDEALDELSSYFSGKTPKICITTSKKCSQVRSCIDIQNNASILQVLSCRIVMISVLIWFPFSPTQHLPSEDRITR